MFADIAGEPGRSRAVALTLLWASVFSSVGQIFDVYGLEGTARVAVTACYVWAVVVLEVRGPAQPSVNAPSGFGLRLITGIDG